MLSLNQMLIDFDVAHLRAIAGCLGVELESNAARDIADQLTGALLTPAFLADLLGRLAPAERDALDDLQRAGGRARAHLFLHRFGGIRLWGAGRLERERPWEHPAGAAEALWYKGLIGRGFAQEGGDTVEFVFIPRDLLRRLPAPAERPRAPIIAQALSAVEPAEAPDGLEDLYELLLYAQLRRPRPTSDGLLAADDLARLRERLSAVEATDADEPAERLIFLQHLARRLGLLEVQSHRLRLTAETARAWLDQPAALQRRAMQDAWKGDEAWNDLAHVPTLRLEPAGWSNDPLRTRGALLGHLSALPAGAWHSLAGFVASVRAADPDFQRPNADYQSWYIHDRRSDALLLGFEHWDDVEGALIAHYLRRPLRWLGIVAWSRGPADYFCITEAGARCLAGELDLAGDLADDPLQIGDDLTVTLTPEASLYHRLQVERFAERTAGRGRYRITPRSLLQARSQEITLEMARRFVERSAGAPLSDAAEAELRRRWNAHNRVRTRRLILLEFAAPEVLEWLRADPEAAPLLGRAVSEQSVIVSEGRLSRLLARLRRLGLNAEVTSETQREG